MVLTSQAHRRRTPKKNRRIPTIPTGRFGGWIVHVSAVDTGPRRSESGVLGDRARRRRGVEPPPQLPPTLRRLPHPAPATWGPICITPSLVLRTEPSPGHLGPITRHQRHDLKHRALSGARAKARKPWFDADPARTEPAPPRVDPSRSTPRGSGSTDHGLCVLHEGPTYPQYPQPSSSSTPPSCSASRRHQQAPEQLRAAGPAPPEERAVAPTHGQPTPPAS